MKENGFTLIEMMVVIAIISVLVAAMLLGPLNTTLKKARDAKRKSDVYQVGRFLSSCYLPESGAGEYDLFEVLNGMQSKFPQYAKMLVAVPRDPHAQENGPSLYYYQVDANGYRCLLYANLENRNEPITLPGISAPALDGGPGVFQGVKKGWNGSTKYIQAVSR